MKKMNKGALTASDMKQPIYKIMYAGIFGFIVVCCVVSFFPVVWVILSGFKDVKEMYAVPQHCFRKTLTSQSLEQCGAK